MSFQSSSPKRKKTTIPKLKQKLISCIGSSEKSREQSRDQKAEQRAEQKAEGRAESRQQRAEPRAKQRAEQGIGNRGYIYIQTYIYIYI